MDIYFAPMEGITGYVFRNRFNSYFGKYIDRYYTPFIMAHEKCGLTNKEIKDIHPDSNRGLRVIPQVMTNKASEYLQIEPLILEFGYEEINLNFGCPSKTVTTRNRGAGILSDLDLLDNFLYEVFSSKKCDISIKSRIGINDSDEFEEILSIYNKYELKNLILHCRVQNEFYNGFPHNDVFEYALNNSKNSLIYNGNIFKVDDYYKDFQDKSNVKAIMIGRGLLRNPSLASEINGEGRDSKELLLGFLNDLCLDYKEAFSGDVPVLHKMKEIWGFMIMDLDDNPPFNIEKNAYKKLTKSKNINEFLINQRILVDKM